MLILNKSKARALYPELRGHPANCLPGFCEVKLDGEFQNIHVRNGKAWMVNKYGTERHNWEKLDLFHDHLAKQNITNAMFLAELYHGDGKVNSIYELNKNKSNPNNGFIVFDITLLNGTNLSGHDYLSRREILIQLLDVRWIDNPKLVTNSMELQNAYLDATAQGYEGVVVKKLSGRLVFGSTVDQAKLKKVDTSHYQLSRVDSVRERIEVLVPSPVLPRVMKPCGVKCPERLKSKLQIGMWVPVTHHGVLATGGLKHPTLCLKDGDAFTTVEYQSALETGGERNGI